MELANDVCLMVGLSSGTSMDGIDAALVKIHDDPAEPLEVVAFCLLPNHLHAWG